MQERGPRIPDTVLEAFFTACQDTPTLRVDQLGDVQGCDSQTAATAAVFVLPPAPYIPLFDAEDALADLRAQRTAWQGNVKIPETRFERCLSIRYNTCHQRFFFLDRVSS